MAGAVLVFDFDKTIIDCDSDEWVVEGFGVTDLMVSILYLYINLSGFNSSTQH